MKKKVKPPVQSKKFKILSTMGENERVNRYAHLGPHLAQYLEDRISDFFKNQVEMDEAEKAKPKLMGARGLVTAEALLVLGYSVGLLATVDDESGWKDLQENSMTRAIQMVESGVNAEPPEDQEDVALSGPDPNSN